MHGVEVCGSEAIDVVFEGLHQMREVCGAILIDQLYSTSCHGGDSTEGREREIDEWRGRER
jgi:hypothetical protein